MTLLDIRKYLGRCRIGNMNPTAVRVPHDTVMIVYAAYTKTEFEFVDRWYPVKNISAIHGEFGKEWVLFEGVVLHT